MFASRKTGWIGFDLGVTSVKAAQVVRGASGEYRLRAAAIVPRRERWNFDGATCMQPVSSADELLAAASLCGALSGRKAAASLPMVLCDALQVDARLSGHRSQEELVRRVEAEVHRSLSDSVLDSWQTKAQPDKLNVISAPRSWSDRVSADVASGGWDCRAIDAVPWALARAASMLRRPKKHSSLVALDWGWAKATLCLVDQGVPVLVRVFKDCGLQSMLAALGDGLKLGERDAENVLRRYGLAGDAAAPDATCDAVTEVLAAPLGRLEHELRRTLNFWQRQGAGLKPERILLFGGGASLAGVDRRLAQALDLPVDVWRLPYEKTAEDPGRSPAHLFGAAAGLSALAWGAL